MYFRTGSKVAVLLVAVAVILAGTARTSLAQATMEAGAAARVSGGMRPVPVPMPQVPTGAQQQNAAPAQAAPATPVQAEPANAAGQTEEQAASAPLRVMVGKSLLIRTQDPIRRVSVTDPAIADAVAVSPTQVLVHGRSPGEVSLIIWDQQERSRNFDLRVDVDSSTAAEEIHRALPGENISVTASRNAIVLTGYVSSKEEAERAGAIASAFSKNVVNALSYGPIGNEEILLEVKFAEVDRTALTQLGVNIFSTGAGNTFGGLTTQQFGGFTGSKIGAVTSDVQTGQLPPGNNTVTSEINNQLFHQPGTFGMNDLLNIFLFRTDANIGAVIKALQQKNILQILAEPNLIAVDGKEASFLAGGEFPFPILQGVTGAVTIQFKEFGVRLRFIPTIMPNGNIHLRVTPEVSALDFTNALTVTGFVIPAISTRRADTELEMKDGQSFVIAGLMDNRLTSVMSKVPGLSNIPILGNLFKSKNLEKSKTELMVLVTARRISPSNLAPALPQYPEKFMEHKSTEQATKPAGGQ